jgi:AcrR family transcriptional regulator
MHMAGTAELDALAPRTVPRQRRAIERRRAILDATLALLEEHNVDAVTTSLIAARAGVPVASIYGYFPNKMAVIAELIREAMAEVDDRLTGILPTQFDRASIGEAIDRSIETIVAGYRALPARQRLFSAVRGNPTLEPVVRASDARMTEALTAAIQLLNPTETALRAQAMAQTVVQTFTALQDGVVACNDPALCDALVAEWRALIKGYLLPMVGQ